MRRGEGAGARRVAWSTLSDPRAQASRASSCSSYRLVDSGADDPARAAAQTVRYRRLVGGPGRIPERSGALEKPETVSVFSGSRAVGAMGPFSGVRGCNGRQGRSRRDFPGSESGGGGGGGMLFAGKLHNDLVER